MYKKYRQRKYKRELDKLRDDLANRGLAQSTIRANEKDWLKEDYDDDIAMRQEEVELHEEQSKERKISIRTNRILSIITILSFFVTLAVSFVTIRLSKEALNLNYLPSIDVQYDATKEQIQIYNRGETNLYIAGSRFNDEMPSIDGEERLITPGGFPYHFAGQSLNQVLAVLLADKRDIFVPFELLLRDIRGEKYISKNFFYVFRKNRQMGIDVQTTLITRSSW